MSNFKLVPPLPTTLSLDLVVVIIAIIIIVVTTSPSSILHHHHPIFTLDIIIAIIIIVVTASPLPRSHSCSNLLQSSSSPSGDYLIEIISEEWGYLQWYWERQISLDENISWWQEEISAAISRNASVAGICALPSSNCSLFRGKRIQSLSSSSISRRIFSSFWRSGSMNCYLWEGRRMTLGTAFSVAVPRYGIAITLLAC